MRILIVLTILELCQLVSTKLSIQCIPTNENCKPQHNLVCDRGRIEILYVKLVIGRPQNAENCNCDKEKHECIINDNTVYVKQKCEDLQECSIPVQAYEQAYGLGREKRCEERKNGTLRAISSNITYECLPGDEKDADLSSIVIASTVSALVVVTIVLIVFAVVFIYKRKISAKKESIKNEITRAGTFQSDSGFDGEYNPIPEDYDRISRVDSQHVYHTIGTSIKNGYHSSLNTAAGDDYDSAKHDGHSSINKATGDDYDTAKHDGHSSVNTAAGDDYHTAEHDGYKQHNGKSTYSDGSNYNSINSGSYNKLKFDKEQNMPTNNEDYSHMNEQKDDYSHIGDSVDNLKPAVNDYNKLHEKMKKEENYDDAITPSNADCNDATDVKVKNGSIKRKGSYEEPVTVDELNTDHLEADHVVQDNGNDRNSLVESSDLTNQECSLPQKAMADDSDADSNSSVPRDSLQVGEGKAKSYKHDSAESTAIDADDDAGKETKIDIRTDTTRDAKNDQVESTTVDS